MSVVLRCTQKQGNTTKYNTIEFKSLASAETFYTLVSTALFKSAYGSGVMFENPIQTVPIDDFNYRFHCSFIVGNSLGTVMCNVAFVKKTIKANEFVNYVKDCFAHKGLSIDTFVWCKFPQS